MPRKYSPRGKTRYRYRMYDTDNITEAVRVISNKLVTVKEASKFYKIPISTLKDKVRGKHPRSHGGQQVFCPEEEEAICENLILVANYGIPLSYIDIKLFVKGYLCNQKREVKRFKNNTPGDDWVRSFVKRNRQLTQRMCQNIKRARAQLKPSEVSEYYQRLAESLEGVPPENILNYDETNLADDPGMKKCIFRRGVKYPERLINFSKGNISLLFSGSASGELLPPYVIYKSLHLWDTWCTGGPPNARYGRSKHGWMTSNNFEEWFDTIVVPWARRLSGKKVLIGDNLSSHISISVIQKCNKHNIAFILLPPNSTHVCQPLDVAFFGPQKRAWRQILEEHKTRFPTSTGLDKSTFPSLLKRLIDDMGLKNTENIKAGFKACGICPFSPEAVLKKLPSEKGNQDSPQQKTHFISQALLEYLQKFRYDPERTPEKRQNTTKKKLSILPGKSVSEEEAKAIVEAKQPKRVPKRKITSEGVASAKVVKAAKIPALPKTKSKTRTVSPALPRIMSKASSQTSVVTSVTKDSATATATILPQDLSDVSCSEKAAIGDYVLVRLQCGKHTKYRYYVAEVMTSDADDLMDIKFLRQSLKAPNRFSYPNAIDTSEIEKEDIVMKLPSPNKQLFKTKRQGSLLTFGSLDLTYCE